MTGVFINDISTIHRAKAFQDNMSIVFAGEEMTYTVKFKNQMRYQCVWEQIKQAFARQADVFSIEAFNAQATEDFNDRSKSASARIVYHTKKQSDNQHTQRIIQEAQAEIVALDAARHDTSMIVEVSCR